MKSIHNMLVVQTFVDDIVANVFQTAFIYQTQNKLPHFILQNINSALSEATLHQLRNNPSQHLATLIPKINDHAILKSDNRAPAQCKTQLKPKSPTKSTPKGHSRYTRTISMMSQNLQTSRDLRLSRENSEKVNPQYRVKPMQKSFIKLQTQSNNEIEDFKNEEKLRHQLTTKRFQKATYNLFKDKRKNSEKKRQTLDQFNDLKKFIFHYDSTILKGKQKAKKTKEQPQQENQRNRSSAKIKSFEEISELDSFVEKHQILSKKKKSLNQASMPQIVQSSSQSKKGLANSQKSKNYRQQVKINEERSKSVIDLISKQAKVQKGVVFKQSIDGKIEQLKKESVDIEKKVRELSRKQFQTSFAKKKFISRVQKALNDI